MTYSPIRVLIIDQHVMVRRGMQAMLAEISDILVVGEASRGIEAFSQLESLKPRVIIIDWKRPTQEEVDAIQEMTSRHANLRVLALSNYPTIGAFLTAFNSGVQGFHIKEVDPDGLITAIRHVDQYGIFIHPTIARLLKQLEDRISLSGEQAAVLHLLSRGMGYEQIMDYLNINPSKLNRHIQIIIAKFT